MRWVVAVPAIVACYSPAVPSGAPCDPASPSCPRGQMCASVSGSYVCTSSGGVPSETDLDGDGVLDEADNCAAVANAGQANEDGDAVGDACDPCPPVAETIAADADRDGVSDPCDPRPAIPGDRIALFEGFTVGIPQGWSRDGSWPIANGVASTDTESASTLAAPGLGSTHHTVSAAFTIEAIAANTDASAGVIAGYDDAQGRGLYCHVTRWADTFPLVVNAMQTDGTVSTRAPFEMVANTPYIARLRRDDGLFTCSGVTGPRTVVTPPLVAPAIATRIGLRASNVRIRFAWLLVVENP